MYQCQLGDDREVRCEAIHSFPLYQGCRQFA
jgi:hypothetical protein